jgi:hypothetical protein
MIISHCLANPQDTYHICQTYRTCGQKVGVSGTRFERALRHEIRIHAKSELTNKEFVAQAVDDIRIRLIHKGLNTAYQKKAGRTPRA